MIDLNYFLLHKTSLVTCKSDSFFFFFWLFWQGGVNRHLTRLVLFSLSLLFFWLWHSTVFYLPRVSKTRKPYISSIKQWSSCCFCFEKELDYLFSLSSLPSLLVEQYYCLDSTLLQEKYKCSVEYTFFFYYSSLWNVSEYRQHAS